MTKRQRVRVSSVKEEYGIGIPIGDDIGFTMSASESILNMLAKQWDFNFEIKVLERSNEILAIVTLHETSRVTIASIIEALNNSL